MQSASDEHVVKQDVAPQTYGEHVVVVDVEHAPEPVHAPAFVAMPPVQFADRHVVEADGYAQLVRVEPSHVPPQTVPSVAHAVRPAMGAPVAA
jgi:hypothetical protein